MDLCGAETSKVFRTTPFSSHSQDECFKKGENHIKKEERKMAYRLSTEQITRVVENGARALSDYCQKSNIHYVVVGSSGGLDSAVTLGFAERASQMAFSHGFKLTLVGLIMPCESKPWAEKLGREAIQRFNAKEIRINLTDFLHFATAPGELVSRVDKQVKRILEETGSVAALSEWDKSKKVAQGNIRARLRMMFGVYHVARMMKGMVLSTDNLSEFWMAFWTICGDVGDFGIIQQILKGLELYDIARYLGVPKRIIEARPDDGLEVSDGGDEGQLGASYPVLDRVMIQLIQKGFDPDGSLKQIQNLPEVSGAPSHVVRALATRSLLGAYKRKGTIVLSRKELGLLPIREIPVE